MKAVVLVGGFGTRLRPLTLTTPKQMLPVVNRPMIDRVLEHLGRHGVDCAVLALGYRPDAFVDAYPDGRCGGVELLYAVEPEPLDTAGAIRFAAEHAEISSRFIVVNGDVLTDLDIGDLVSRHAAAGAEGTIALHPVDDPSAYGVVATDDDGRVLTFVEKPPRGSAPSNLINAGTYVLEPSVLNRIEPGVRVNVEREVFPTMAADGGLFAWDGHCYWIDAGTPSSYLQANLDIVNGTRPSDSPATHPSAKVAGRIDQSVVGSDVVIEAGAAVVRSVLLPGAVVRAGARVVESLIGSRATVGEGAVVEGHSIVGDDVAVEPGARMTGLRDPEVGQ